MASSITRNMTHAMQQVGSDLLAQGHPQFSFASVGDEFVSRMTGTGKPGLLETISVFFKKLWHAVKDVFTGGRASLERQLKEEIALARAQQERLRRFNHVVVTTVDTLIQAEHPEKMSGLRRELAGVLVHPEQQEAARKAIVDHHHALSDADAKLKYREAVVKLFQDLPEAMDSDEALVEILKHSLLKVYPPECLERFDVLPPEELKSLAADVRAKLKPPLENFKATLETFFNKGIVQEQLHPFVEEYAAANEELKPEALQKTGEALKAYFTGTLAERTLMGEIVRERWSQLKKDGQEAAERLAKAEKTAQKTAKGTEPSLDAEMLRQTAEAEHQGTQEEQRKYKEALTALLKHLEPKNLESEEEKVQKVGFDKLAAQINATLADEPPWWVGLGKLGASIGLSGAGDSLLSPYLGIYATPFIGSIARHYAESAPIGQTGRRFAVDAAGYAAAYRLFPDSPLKRFAFQIATAIGNSKLDGYAPLESWENQATSYWNDLWTRMFGT